MPEDDVESYLRKMDRTLRLPREQRDEIVRELRSHVEEKAAELRRADPRLSEKEAVRRALEDLGDPRDLAISYGATETVVRTSRGETVARVARAIGRGTRTALKWTAISIAGLLVVGAVGSVWAYYEFKPVVARHATVLLYHEIEDCEPTTCGPAAFSRTFPVYAEAREVSMTVEVDQTPQPFGTVTVTVQDPDGRTKYERTFGGDPQRAAENEETRTWVAVTGDWTVTYRFTGFDGSVRVLIEAVGLPLGET